MQNNEGDTALLIASNEGYPEVARLLLKSCAQVDNIGRSALIRGLRHDYARAQVRISTNNRIIIVENQLKNRKKVRNTTLYR